MWKEKKKVPPAIIHRVVGQIMQAHDFQNIYNNTSIVTQKLKSDLDLFSNRVFKHLK